MDTMYTSRDYTFKLDRIFINASHVWEEVLPNRRGGSTDAFIHVHTALPEGFNLDVGQHTITVVPKDKSKPTVTYPVLLLSTMYIAIEITFLRSGAPEESPTITV